MHSIEIPFYIYSGKILQDHQRGSGIFIVKSVDEAGKAVGKTDSVKFVFHNQTDHDAIHTFSSGQLAALSISFMLSLNRVFGDSALGFILIDDPIQSMDDINMISLVDLLRNDFGDRQIIVSTHEEEFSAYSRYKFKKSGFKVGRFDARKEFFLSNEH